MTSSGLFKNNVKGKPCSLEAAASAFGTTTRASSGNRPFQELSHSEGRATLGLLANGNEKSAVGRTQRSCQNILGLWMEIRSWQTLGLWTKVTVSNGNTDLRNKPLAFGWGSQFCKNQSSWPIMARLWIRAIVSAGNQGLGKTNSRFFG